MNAPPARRLFTWLITLEGHHRFAIALAAAGLAFAAGGHWRLPVRIIGTWDAYALVMLTLAWTHALSAQPREVVQMARITRTNRKLIFVVVLGAACGSLMAVAFLLNTAKDLAKTSLFLHVALTVGTVMLSWLVLHTLFTLHYAYLYYRPSHPGEKRRGSGGLTFPEPTEPDYLDFAYFSFVIGMTSQVSDVQISSREIRRWALLHGVVSFGFNTAVLALSLNIVSGLL